MQHRESAELAAELEKELRKKEGRGFCLSILIVALRIVLQKYMTDNAKKKVMNSFPEAAVE